MANACSKNKVVITKDDLPLSCPMPNQNVKNAHPKVYLPIEDTKHEICKYCSTEYILKDS
jgi:uncharacterized Zn-finger protein